MKTHSSGIKMWFVYTANTAELMKYEGKQQKKGENNIYTVKKLKSYCFWWVDGTNVNPNRSIETEYTYICLSDKTTCWMLRNTPPYVRLRQTRNDATCINIFNIFRQI